MKSFNPDRNYIEYEYEGMKVYIHKSLLIKRDITIYRKMKVPMFSSIIGVKGVSIKDML